MKNRPIKFKVWDSVNKTFTTEGIGIDQEVTLLQFVGLRDTKRTEEYPNGQEIWEGDIVNAWDAAAEDPTWSFDKVHLGVVEYNENAFCLNCLSFKTNPTGDSCYLKDWTRAENIEVVGNIFENEQWQDEFRIN
jgi:uncharacterized phage protein (TIGR01671 family)